MLRQAWDERLTLLLALNKIDRLVVEIKLTPSQAYETMCRVIEQVNSVLAEMFSADMTRQRDGMWQTNIDELVSTYPFCTCIHYRLPDEN